MATSRSSGTLTTFILAGVLLGACILRQNVTAKSVPSRGGGWRMQTEETTTDLGTIEDNKATTPEGITESPPPEPVILDWSSKPEEEAKINSTTSFRYALELNPNFDYRLAVHLKSCNNFEEDAFIKIYDGTLKKLLVRWKCSKRLRFDDEIYSSQNRTNTLHAGDQYVKIHDYRDDLTDVIIVPEFQSDTNGWADVVVNIYKQIPLNGACSEDSFDCYQDLCPERCCSESSGSSNSGSKNNKAAIFGITSSLSRSKSGASRCIPLYLKCNNRPNCGMETNSDETNEVCHSDTCPCQSLCLTWNYILTSLAIAVLFIITPTAVVFALFHRRNVALERARLLRLAQQRVTDIHGECTRDAPANDHPPTYDEVYDIKVPPPCFCEAMAWEDGVKDGENENDIDMEQGATSDNLDGRNPDGGIRNRSFQCSCNTMTTVDLSDDQPPSFTEAVGGTEESRSGERGINDHDA